MDQVKLWMFCVTRALFFNNLFRKPAPIDCGMQTEPSPLRENGEQTEMAQFRVDEATQYDSRMRTDKATETEYVKHASTGAQVNFQPRVMSVGVVTECKYLQDRSVEAADPRYFINRSMETMNGSIWRGECSRSVQTMFPEEEGGEDELLAPGAEDKRRRFSNSKRYCEFEMEVNEQAIQCRLQEDTCDMGIQTDVGGAEIENALATLEYPSLPLHLLPSDEADRRGSCSDSIVVFSGDEDEETAMTAPKVTKQDLIIQTDDSYLRIARRLTDLRTNKTQSLQIYAAGTSTTRSPKVLITTASEDADRLGTAGRQKEMSGSRSSVVRWQDEEGTETSSRRSSIGEESRPSERAKKRTSFLEPEPRSPTSARSGPRSMAQRIRQSLR